MTEPVLDSSGQPGRWRGVAVEIFLKNEELSLVSGILFALMIGLIPAGYILGAYFVTPQDCVEQTQLVYAALFGIVVCYSAYAWIAERPKVWRAVRAELARKRLRIQKLGWSYEVDDGTQKVRFGVYSLIAVAIWILMMLSWCFWDPIVIKACAGQLHGNPDIAPVMLGTTFALVVPHQVVMWGYVVLSAGRASA